jgi:uncharacterized protein (DUF433 family)
MNDDIITTTPGLRSGQPTIRGTRLVVADVLSYLAAGMTDAELMADFPGLTAEDIQACRDWQQEHGDVQTS